MGSFWMHDNSFVLALQWILDGAMRWPLLLFKLMDSCISLLHVQVWHCNHLIDVYAFFNDMTVMIAQLFGSMEKVFSLLSVNPSSLLSLWTLDPGTCMINFTIWKYHFSLNFFMIIIICDNTNVVCFLLINYFYFKYYQLIDSLDHNIFFALGKVCKFLMLWI